MILTFRRPQVERLLAHTRAALMHRTLYDDPSSGVAGLWLVADDGVYLMSNGFPPPLQEGRGANGQIVVAYAEEAHPKAIAFNFWWAAKVTSCGREDITRFIPVATIHDALQQQPKDAYVRLDVTPTHIGAASPSMA